MKNGFMARLLSVSLMVAFLFLPLAAFAQDGDTSDLQERIASLEAKIDKLEKLLNGKEGGSVGWRKGISRRMQKPVYSSYSAFDPFYEMSRMQSFVNNLLSYANDYDMSDNGFLSSGMFNAMLDMEERDNAYIVKVDLPGMDKDSINIEIKDGQLIISGEKRSEYEEDNKSGNYYRRERSVGYFSRVIPLPDDVNEEKINAEYKNGVLMVTLPKKEESIKKAKKKKIKIL